MNEQSNSSEKPTAIPRSEIKEWFDAPHMKRVWLYQPKSLDLYLAKLNRQNSVVLIEGVFRDVKN